MISHATENASSSDQSGSWRRCGRLGPGRAGSLTVQPCRRGSRAGNYLTSAHGLSAGERRNRVEHLEVRRHPETGEPRWVRTASLIGAVVMAAGSMLVTPAAQAQTRSAGGPDGGPALTVGTAVLAHSLSCVTGAIGHGPHRPVLLVHGTGLTPEQSWAWNYGAVLPREGYPTCTVALPQAALGGIQVASEYVVYAVDAMAARWRSSVDIIGHSQGGLEPRWALRWWPGLRDKVDHYIGLASPNHGIYAADACADSGNCWPAVWQMTQTSKFLTALNRGNEAPGPTSYTDIYSETDDLVQPGVVDPTAALAPLCQGPPTWPYRRAVALPRALRQPRGNAGRRRRLCPRHGCPYPRGVGRGQPGADQALHSSLHARGRRHRGSQWQCRGLYQRGPGLLRP